MSDMYEANDTIFGAILRGEIPSTRVWEDDQCIAFRDISPAAPTHILIIPRKHIPTLADATAADRELLGHMLLVAGELARAEGIDQNGFRVVINANVDGGQTVYHLHMHVLGGRRLGWPPG